MKAHGRVARRPSRRTPLRTDTHPISQADSLTPKRTRHNPEQRSSSPPPAHHSPPPMPVTTSAQAIGPTTRSNPCDRHLGCCVGLQAETAERVDCGAFAGPAPRAAAAALAEARHSHSDKGHAGDSPNSTAHHSAHVHTGAGLDGRGVHGVGIGVGDLQGGTRAQCQVHAHMSCTQGTHTHDVKTLVRSLCTCAIWSSAQVVSAR